MINTEFCEAIIYKYHLTYRYESVEKITEMSDNCYTEPVRSLVKSIVNKSQLLD